jgi:hypothetical protein
MIEFPKVSSYEEAVKVIQNVGILPLSPLIPDHPSLESITNKSDWHTETEMDPWQWRVRFPGDGVAAYGKFFKKKSILIATELVPWIKSIIGNQSTMKDRYSDGLIYLTVLKLQQLIEENPGIETRTLRAQSDLKATDQKKQYDQAITDLQGSMDIVISGVKQRFNDNGDKNGWNSTSFETANHWMTNNHIDINLDDPETAKEKLQAWLQPRCNPEALNYIRKLLGIK